MSPLHVIYALILALLCQWGIACSTPNEVQNDIPLAYELRATQSSPEELLATVIRNSPNSYDDFSLAVSNSTKESVYLLLFPDEHCFSETFLLYAKLPPGLELRHPLGSFKCGPKFDSVQVVEIPQDSEATFNISILIASRGLSLFENSNYVVKIRYFDAAGQEYFLLSDEFEFEAKVSSE